MGQTLTHGVYLPDEGERNCYSGLAGNWSILDGAVGTIAEHTTALAGKAPAVHTHTVSDITDFPAYGNAAGTICEGNDSRLSDARTPVAHTHTKSDVTDLFNSANTWTETNTYFKQVAIGNVTSYTDCALGFTGLYNTLFFNTRGSSNINSYGTYVYYGYSNASSDRGGVIRMVRTTDKRGDTNDGYIPDLSFNLYKISTAKLFIDFMEAVRVTNDGTENSLKPITDNTTDLGTSTNKWKTLNGIAPGELSLPNMGATASQTIDITDWYIPDPDDPTYPDENAKKIDDSVEHTIESSSHVGAGYIHITIPNVAGNYVYARQYAAGGNMRDGRIADGLAFSAFPDIPFIFPIVNALKVGIKAKTAVVRFFPCLGNV